MKAKKKVKKKDQNIFWEKKRILIAIIVLIAMLSVLSWIYSDSIQKSSCLIVKSINGISYSLTCESGENTVLDVFYVIWVGTITVILFLLEFGNVYSYGVTLKRVINLSLNKVLLVIVAIEYVLLCPLVYVAMVYEKWCTALWGVICTYVMFFSIPLYIVYKTRKKQIKALLSTSTIRELRDKVNVKNKKIEHLQKEIESLSIVDMIKHIDYDDSKEVQELINTLTQLFEENHVLATTKNNEYEHVFIMVCVDCIVRVSGLSTPCERERTVYVLRKLWECITSSIEKMNTGQIESINKDTISCTIQILCPLIKIGTKEAAEVYRKLWESVMPIRSYVLWYLLLYEEYLYYSRGGWQKNHCISTDIVRKDRHQLAVGTILWNKEMAWEFWRSWSVLQESGHNIAIALFSSFCSDIVHIQKGEIQKVKTYIIRRYYWETR